MDKCVTKNCMKRNLKFIVGILAVGLLTFVGFRIWVVNKIATIQSLAIEQEDSIADKLTKTNNWLENLQSDQKFNGGVLLVKNDSVIFKKTYGYNDYTKKEKLNTKSSFRLASVSKQFTAVGIMILTEKGMLDFDEVITKYLPNLPYNNVTVRNLLNHTSGIPDIYMSFPQKYPKEIGNALSISKVVELLAQEDLKLVSNPNEQFSYNNTGYVLLAAIIENVTGKTFEGFMKDEVFDKLGMENTRVWNLFSETSSFSNRTGSFENIQGEFSELRPGVIDGVAGDGGIFSSIDDFVIWNMFWYNDTLLPKAIKEKAFEKAILNNGSTSNYGFGWSVESSVAHGHNGSWLGARTSFTRNTRLRNAIVVLDNSASPHINTIVQELSKVLK
jgi:CubicO group peptidase (beta-lactamase class C family)